MEDQPSEPSSESAKPTPKPWQFKKGNKARQQGAAAAKPDAEPQADAGDGKVPDLLKAMRYVFRHASSSDRSHAQKNARKFFETDANGFMKQLTALERAYAAGKELPKGKGDPDPDPGDGEDKGTGRALALIDQLLDEWDAKQQADGTKR